jgi:hypothetical protein
MPIGLSTDFSYLQGILINSAQTFDKSDKHVNRLANLADKHTSVGLIISALDKYLNATHSFAAEYGHHVQQVDGPAFARRRRIKLPLRLDVDRKLDG